MRAFLSKIAAALTAFGPWGVFALTIIDSAGVPLPAAVDALIVGVAASAKSAATAYFTAFLAVIGSIGGNAILFWLSRQGQRLLSREDGSPGKRRRFQEWFLRYGMLTIFVPAVVPFAPLPLKVFVISAGALHSPFGPFLLTIAAARVIRYFALAYLGLQLGLDARGFLIHNGWQITGIVLLLAAAALWVLRAADRNRSTAAR